MTKVKVLLTLAILSVAGIVGGLILGFETQNQTGITFECPYESKNVCTSTQFSPNYPAIAYYFGLALLLIISSTWLTIRLLAGGSPTEQPGRPTTVAAKILVVANLLLVAIIGIAIWEYDEYSFASYNLFVAPTFLLVLAVGTIAYALHRRKVRRGESTADNRATILLSTVWIGFALTYLFLSPLLELIDPLL